MQASGRDFIYVRNSRSQVSSTQSVVKAESATIAIANVALSIIDQFSVLSFHLSALTTSSLTLAPTGVDRWFRDTQGATFAGATCDLSLPMLSNPRLLFSFDKAN